MASIAHERGLLAIDDLGSGTLLDTAAVGLEHEPTVQESIAAGADMVSFSGDKLLGGPQAGIILGKRKTLAQIRKNPLNRALRIDKLTLAALEATLMKYLRPEEALVDLRVLRALTEPLDAVKKRAKRLAALLRRTLPQGLTLSLREGRIDGRRGIASHTGDSHHPDRHLCEIPFRGRSGGRSPEMENADHRPGGRRSGPPGCKNAGCGGMQRNPRCAPHAGDGRSGGMMTDVKTSGDERHHRFTVAPGEEGLRLDLFLTGKEPGLSRAQIQRAVAEGRVLVNGRPIKAGRTGEGGRCRRHSYSRGKALRR